MDDALTSGKVGIVGIAGSFEAAVAARTAKLPLRFVQLADPPFERTVERLRASVGAGWPAVLSTHSIFGRHDVVAMLGNRAGSPARLRELLAAHGYEMPMEQAVRAALLDWALARNAHGIVLLSMFTVGHLRRNAAALDRSELSRAQDFFLALSGVAAA